MFPARSQYIYASGVISTWQSDLLDEKDVERMVDAKSADEALKVLYDLDYSEHLREMKGKKIEEFQKVLDMELKEKKDALKKMAPKPELLNFLWLEYEFDNIKTLFKSWAENAEIAENISNIGDLKSEDILAFLNGKNASLPENFEKILKKAKDIYAEKKDLEDANNYLDKMYWQALSENISKHGGDLSEFLRTKIDLYNIKNFFRLKAIGKSAEEFEKFLIKGGKLERSFFKNLFSAQDNIVLDVFAKSEYEALAPGIEMFLKTKTVYSKIESLSGNILKKTLDDFKYENYGIRQITHFWHAKRNDIKNIRSILIKKIYDFDIERIKRHLRETY